jgi:hypothetical protein
VAYINVSETGQFVTLEISATAISTTATTGNIVMPGLQNITLNNGNGVFRWKQLDSGSEKAIAIAATNQISMNIVLDPTAYFGDSAATNGTAAKNGLFKLSNDKTLVYFRLYYAGKDTGDNFVTGSGYLTGLAPTVTPDQPVWVAPITIDVVGEFTPGTL